MKNSKIIKLNEKNIFKNKVAAPKFCAHWATLAIKIDLVAPGTKWRNGMMEVKSGTTRMWNEELKK